MLFSTYNQGYSFLLMVYSGVLIAIVYDVFRLVRRLFGRRKFLAGVFDAFFWLVASVIALAGFYIACEGEIRFYAIAGLALGVLVYAFGLGILVRWLIDRAVKLLSKLRHTRFIDAIAKRIMR